MAGAACLSRWARSSMATPGAGVTPTKPSGWRPKSDASVGMGMNTFLPLLSGACQTPPTVT